MRELSAVLERERELLDQLRFRVVETNLLLFASETRYLEWATAEVEQARIRAREADLLRAAQLHRLCDENAQLRSSPRSRSPRGGMVTLREVASAAVQPWAGILRDHHEGLCATVSEIEVTGHRNAELARSSISALAQRTGPSLFDGWLQSLGSNDSSSGLALEERTPAAPDSHDLADERVFQEVISSASRLHMPALLAFLR